MDRKRTSVAFIVIVALVAATTASLGVLGHASYRPVRDARWQRLRESHAATTEQLSVALALPIWNFEHEQIDRIVESTMRNEAVSAVVVRLADRNHTIHARARDASGKLRVAQGERDIDSEGLTLLTHAITLGNDVLGTVEVLITPRFAEAELAHIRSSIVAIVVIVDAVLVLGLYLLLNELVLEPLRSLERFAAGVRSGSRSSDELGSVRFRGELRGLKDSTEAMISLLDARYADLQKSEQEFRSLFETTPVSLWEEDMSAVRARLDELRAQGVVDLERYLAEHPGVAAECAARIRVLDVNQATLDLHGAREKAELLGNIARTFAPESLVAFHAGLLAMWNGRTRMETDGVVQTLAGEPRRVVVRWSVVPGFERTWARALVCLSDVTERRRAEEALRLSEERFRSAMQHSPVGMGICAPDGRWLEVNPRLCAIVGYERDELLATDFESITHPDDHAADQALGRRLMSREIESGGIEKRYLHRDGRVVWVQVNVSLVWNADGTPRHFVAQIQDITARREAEQALREYQSKLELSMDLAGLAPWELDLESRKVMASESLFRIYRTTAAEQGGLEVEAEAVATKFWGPDAAELFNGELELMQSATDPAFTHQMEHGIVRADGSRGVVALRYSIVKDGAGRTVRAYGVTQDITERKNLEEQMLRMQRVESVGRLANGVAHDLNNILTPILMGSELFSVQGWNADDLHYRDMIRRSAERGADIVRQLLLFSRGVETDRIPTDVRKVLSDTVRMIRDTFPKTIDFQIHVPPDLWLVMGDATQLQQIALNLCVNARDAMGTRGRLEVGAENVVLDADAARARIGAQPGHYVVVNVSDSGCGIPPQILDKIWDPFFTTKPLGHGTGLGLSTVLGISRSHGGFVEVQSEVGRGTQILVYLPALQDRPIAAAETPDAGAEHGHGELILVVDDEEMIRETTRRALELSGYRVVVAANGFDGLASYAARRGEIAAVITDLWMPFLDGISMISELKKLDPGARVIAVSGLAELEQQLSHLRDVVRRFLVKPVPLAELVNAVDQLLGGDGQRARAPSKPAA